jgi:hypothetical protein
MTDPQSALEYSLRNEELGENAKDFLARLKELVFTWKVEEVGDPGEAEIIMGFSFGYVLDKNGNRLPGKINQQDDGLTIWVVKVGHRKDVYG